MLPPTFIDAHGIIRMRAVLALAVAIALYAHANAACGDRGGPGYRAPNGRCVGWADIGKTCGSPPTKNCIAENASQGAQSAADHGVKIEALRPSHTSPALPGNDAGSK